MSKPKPNEVKHATRAEANRIGSISVESEPSADCLAVALASYFERHIDRPENDPLDETGTWGQWVIEKTNAALELIAWGVRLRRDPSLNMLPAHRLERYAMRTRHKWEGARLEDELQPLTAKQRVAILLAFIGHKSRAEHIGTPIGKRGHVVNLPINTAWLE